MSPTGPPPPDAKPSPGIPNVNCGLCALSFAVALRRFSLRPSSLRCFSHATCMPVNAVIMAPNRGPSCVLPLAAVLLLFVGLVGASAGDRLPEFKQCLDVSRFNVPELCLRTINA